MARAFAPQPVFQPVAAAAAGRYLIVPCEAADCADLSIIWDRLEEQVVDVITGSAARYAEEDAMWDQFHAPAFAEDFRMAA